ncbi:MAG: helix-turn-helix domain-containing protein [Blautia wexlerae]|uniref:helix-turn-helix domain-containing protein n=1 Tax=Blautia wexlerae TaxID=418240 RepID=UPI0018A8D5AC|nr:helix-turn-helix domain-containing protein [Blautia wexlerae]MDB6470469.1 helix-turn-helix domain-containing protein [Blautia wexlerae]
MQEIAEKDRSHLEDAVSSFLNDRPRPGQPAHYTDEQIIRILEIACREPQEFGYGVSHWSLNLLVNAVVKEGIVESISAKTVSRFLKYGGNPPASHPLLASFLRENRFSGNFCGESE